ncbi:hypothetical protein B0H67DRAFT_585825 [Lasiosphaeris hirsuta]|uniref:RRM domain-containing protein n=1 Tax=Lasiosphaeris hirsuta TaxID=260670 RepID=A0AA40A9A6_9PEZI|nr:hypothetical protein B0H67DRAFT_585825 [Lasiosphaeris hirsuta]
MGRPGDNKRQRDPEDASEAVEEAVAQDAAVKPPKNKRPRVETNKSLFIRSLPASATSESLTEFFSQHYPVKHATVVIDPKTKASKGFGFVSFADPDDALEAKEKLNNYVLDGRRLKLDIAQPRQRDGSKVGSATSQKLVEEKRKRDEALAEARVLPKLILRNLPWSIKTPEQLSALFQPYGKVKFCDLPNDRGKLSGFGFVTLKNKRCADKAMANLNGKVVDGRTLAVDYAVKKQAWDEMHGIVRSEDASVKEPAKESKAKKSSKSKPVDESEDEENGKEVEEDEEDDDQAGMTQEDKDLANFFKNHEENLESESEHDEEDDDDEDEDNEDEGKEDDDEESGDEDISDLESVDLDDDASEDGGTKLPPKKRIADNSTTLFVRNLPYTATDETVKAHFNHFGPVRYARTVVDRATDRPAGTAFVCFFNEEDFLTCLKGAPRQQPAATLSKHSVLQDETIDQEGKYTLEGRLLAVTQAVSKDEATRLAAEGVRNGKDKDKRRLFLLAEGQISTNSPMYSKLTESEIKMRDASAKQRKKMIQTNPSLHLSLTRLALRNLPRNLDSKDLKALARQAVVGFATDVKEGRREPLSKEENTRGGAADKEAEHRRKEKKKGVVTQAKVVFESADGTKITEKVGGGKSRGYGFIEYSSHRWALMGLRYLNGYAMKNELGKSQRLIVEFAIENANVVQRRRTQEERQVQQQRAGHSGAKPEGFKGAAGKKWMNGKGKGEKGAKEEAPEKGRKVKPKEWNKSTKGLAKEGGGGGRGSGGRAKGGAEPSSKAEKKDADTKLAMRTKIISRKRMMRKKKAVTRAGK